MLYSHGYYIFDTTSVRLQLGTFPGENCHDEAASTTEIVYLCGFSVRYVSRKLKIPAEVLLTLRLNWKAAVLNTFLSTAIKNVYLSTDTAKSTGELSLPIRRGTHVV